MEEADVVLVSMVGAESKTVIVEASFGDLIAVGSSRCHAPDKFDPGIGLDLAAGRALVNLGIQLQGHANKEVARRDEERIARRERMLAKMHADRLATLKPSDTGGHFVLVGGEELTNGDAEPVKKKKPKKRRLGRK